MFATAHAFGAGEPEIPNKYTHDKHGKDKIFGVTSCKRLPRLKGREKRQDGRVTRLIPCSSPRPRRWFFFFLVFFPRRWQWIQLFPALVSPTYSMKTTLQPKLVTNLQVEEIEILDRDSHSLTLLTISTQSNITRYVIIIDESPISINPCASVDYFPRQ